MMKASDVITQASNLLLDANNDFWTSSELLSYVAEGQRQIAEIKPDSTATTASMDLNQGIKQALPSDGIFLIDVVRNLGLTSLTAKPAITAIDQRDLDAMLPNWSEIVDSTVQHYMYDPRNRLVFYVYPAQPTSPGQVEIIYAVRPVAPTAATDTLQVADEYFSPLLDYVLYRAHTKSSSAASANRAIAHWNQFAQQLGLDAKSKQALSAGERDPSGDLR